MKRRIWATATAALLWCGSAQASGGELAAARAQLLSAAQKELTQDAGQVVLGNPQAAHAAAVFFDYRCGFCRRMTPAIAEALQRRRDVKLVVQQMAVLGEESRTAATVALAAADLGAGPAAHDILMHYTGDWSREALTAAVAAGTHLDPAKLSLAAQKPEVQARIAHTLEAASALGVGGTPTFVSAAGIVPGAMQPDALERFLQRTAQP